jgi:hypothetical protein
MCDWKHWLVLGENAAFSSSSPDEKAAFSKQLRLVNRERDDIGF